MKLNRIAALAIVAVLVAGCNSTPAPNVAAMQPASQPPMQSPLQQTGAAPGVTPTNFRLPEGTGCAGDVARWRAIQDNDLNTGHVSRSVYDRIKVDIDSAAAACAAGRSGEASAMVRASRLRNGYPG
jgi:hypothetical protein